MRIRRFTLPGGARLCPVLTAFCFIHVCGLHVHAAESLHLSRIPDLVTSEDTPTQTVPFMISGSSKHEFAFNVTSSNPGLVSECNVTFTGTGTKRALSVTPAANQSGHAVLQLSVSDGSTVVTQAFSLRVTAVNDAPTISRIADQSIAEGGVLPPIQFTIGDVETPAASLIVSASSSNTNLIANDTLAIAGGGAIRTITARPVSGRSGATKIAVSVGDGQASTLREFKVVVGTVNRPPLVNAGANQTLLATNVAALNGTATDDLCPLERLVTKWTVISGSADVTFANPAALNTTVHFTRTGTYNLRLTAFDGELSGSDDITITVEGDRFTALK